MKCSLCGSEHCYMKCASCGGCWPEPFDVSKLSPKDGDLLLMRFSPDWQDDAIERAAHDLAERVAHAGAKVIAMRATDSLAFADEAAMAAAGWVRADKAAAPIKFREFI